MRAGDQEARPPERGNEPALARPANCLLVRTPEKKTSDDPSTKDGIETVRLCASLLRSHLSIDAVSSFFPLTVNNAG